MSQSVAEIAPESGPEQQSVTQPAPAPVRTTVLVVDDARSNRQYVADMLTERKMCDEVLFAEDGLVAFKALRSNPGVDLVVCDLDMPRCDGLKFLRLKATDSTFESIPVIVLTGAEDVTRKVQALTSGASDYVVKPYEPSELAARISVHLKLRKLQGELVRANTELHRLTQIDPLTDVSNRRHLAQKLEEEYLRARRYDRPLSLGLLDLDHFKRLNDTFGHPAGDLALVETAKIIKATLRCHDIVARYGGEEFAMLLPETPADRAILAFERVRAAIEHADIKYDNVRMPVTASLGVASFPHQLLVKPSDFITLADAALYDAKRSGRNRVVAAL
ncbi:MAG TPA: diguanylate cyclase [Polyangiales bacterium]|nr:diguanylate cyclase [Polyangiales bacterium]